MAELILRTLHLPGTEVMLLDEDGAPTQATMTGTTRIGLTIIHQLQIEDGDLAHNLSAQLQGTDLVPSTRTHLTGVMEFLSSG